MWNYSDFPSDSTHTLICLYSPAVARNRPSELKLSASTNGPSVPPGHIGSQTDSVDRHFRDDGSQSLTVSLSTPPARILPSGLKATEITQPYPPPGIAVHLPVATSQSLVVESKLPVASVLPSGWNATDTTAFVWPAKTVCSLPVATSQMRHVLSWLPVAMRLPSGLNFTEVTQSV